MFLLFLHLGGVLFMNMNDATLSSLGNTPNMQIKAVITENPAFVNIAVTMHDIKIILVSITMFWGIKNKIKPFQQRFFSKLYILLNTLIETIIIENHDFVHISISVHLS